MNAAGHIVALAYGLLVAGIILTLWILAISPQDTGIGMANILGYQFFVIAGKTLVFVGLACAFAAIGGLVVAGVALVNLIRGHTPYRLPY